MIKSSEQTLLVNLRKVLAECFDEEEVSTLCFDMRIDYEDIPGSGKTAKARGLVAYCERRRIIPQLVSKVLDTRPDTLSALLSEGVFSPIEDTDRIPFAALDRDIYFFDIYRCEMTKYYIRWAEAANKVDIITQSMQTILDNYGDDRLVEWIIEGKIFRVLVLSPSSAAAKIRGKEEEIPLPNKIATQIKTLQRIYKRARKQVSEGRKKCLGSLEVRLYDGIPYFAYFGTEREIVIGLYFAHKKGLQSEVFLVDAKSPIHDGFQSHFEALWNGQAGTRMSPEDRLVCVISESKLQFMELNRLKKTTGTAKRRRSTSWKPG